MKWLFLLTILIIGVFLLFGLEPSSSTDPYCRNRLSFLDPRVEFVPRTVTVSSTQDILVGGCLKSGTLKSGMSTIINEKRAVVNHEIQGYEGSYGEMSSSNNEANNLELSLSGLETDDQTVIQLLIEKNEALEFK